MSAVALLLAAAARVWALPAVPGARLIFAGEVSINLVPARFALLALPAGGPEALADAAAAAGYRPDGRGEIPVASPGGLAVLRGWERGGAWLLQGASHDPEGWAVQAWFASRPVWADAGGEAPGREPAGWPRLGSARRIAHLAGPGFEAACYRSPAPPDAVAREAVARLRGRGWRAELAGPGAVRAWRSGGPDAGLHASADGRGCRFLVVATAGSR